jgi:hypothetical protein
MTTTKHIMKLISGLLILTLTNCNRLASPNEEPYSNDFIGKIESAEKDFLKGFKFDSYFGQKTGDKNTTYCLLGQGFFRSHSSSNSDNLLKSWLTNHSNAIVLKVSTLTTYEKSNEPHNLIYCWVIEGNETLNNYLIREGCYPGGTMQRPQTWDEMSNEEKELYDNTDKSKVTVHIDKKVYDYFIEKIKAAEKYAKDNKLGIWAKSIDEE